MAYLLNLPKNVLIQQLFKCLDHNDLLRLRLVSKQTKVLADAYLLTPQLGYQGKWELEIDSSNGNQTLQAFLEMGLPPPSRLHIANTAENRPSGRRSFFKDKHLAVFMERCSKYVTTLRIDKLFFPFTPSSEELSFYESLTNLKKLRCYEMITVGGAAQFEEKMIQNAEESFIIPSTFQNLKIFKLDQTDCMVSMWSFINGLSNSLEEIMHPFDTIPSHVRDGNGVGLQQNNINYAHVQKLIERHGGMNSQRKLVYDWTYMYGFPISNLKELLTLFASCFDNGVIIKNLDPDFLHCLYYDVTRSIEMELVEDQEERRVIPERNLFVGSIIKSLEDVNEIVFHLELPALERITIDNQDLWWIKPELGYPEWPNLKKMQVNMTTYTGNDLIFLQGGLKLPKLEELTLYYKNLVAKMYLPVPKNLGISCGNVKELVLMNCPGDNNFFIGLWEELPLLEDITLLACTKLTNKGFVGGTVNGNKSAFLNLKKLKHLTILNLETMPRITDAVFRDVFRHLTLKSFNLTSTKAIEKITVAGIKNLLNGPFAETIEKLDLHDLKLKNVSNKQMKKVTSCFRSSKMCFNY